MAQIRTLMQNDTQVLPRTVAEAVSTDAGSNVQAELDALRGDIENVDVSEQISAHNIAEDAHNNRFNQYLPLTGGTITGNLVISNEEMFDGAPNSNTITFSQTPHIKIYASGATGGDQRFAIVEENSSSGFMIECDSTGSYTNVSMDGKQVFIYGEGVFLDNNYIPSMDKSVVNKKYVDDQIAAIPTPDVSAQIAEHNTSTSAHANMGWITAEDEMLSNIDPDGSIDADTLESHPASDFVLKSELSTLVPAPDLSNYYTKAQVDEKITQIQQLIDQAAALVDEINGEVI